LVSKKWRSGVSAERRHLKQSGKVCGGLPTRRYGEEESFAVPLKIRVIKKSVSVSECCLAFSSI
jgi:hypothetical protein